MRSRLSVSLLVTAAVVAGCGGATTTPPEVVDEWLPPAGAVLDSAQLYRENRHLFDYDARAPLDVQQVGTARTGDVTILDLTYASPKGGRVTATLFVPDGEGPFAGLVLMHGLPSDRGEMTELATAFAATGAVVITIDAPFARPGRAGRSPLMFSIQDREEQIQLIVDLRRAVDVLESRPEVDRRRMGYLGISYGGAMGGLLAGVETRLRAYVLRVGDGGLVTHLTGPEDRGTDFYLVPKAERDAWLELMWPIEPIHYVAHAAPAALLFQNGTEDTAVPPADGLRYQEAGSRPKTTLWYEAGHGLTRRAVGDAVAWLQDVGGLGLGGTAAARRIDRGLLMWLALTIGSLLALGWAFWRERPTHWGSTLVWVLVVLFLGPLGLLAYLYLYRRPRRAAPTEATIPTSGRALGSTLWSGAGNLVGVFVIVISAAYHPALVFLVPLATGLLIYGVSRLPKGDQWTTHAQPLTVQLLSTNMILTGAYFLVPFALDRFDRWYPFGEPFWAVWSLLVAGSVAAVLTGYPVHRWMVGRRLVRWGPGPAGAEPRRLTPYRALALILVTFAVLFGAVQGAIALAG